MPRVTVEVRSADVVDVELLLELAAAARQEAGHEPRADQSPARPRVLAALQRPDVDVLIAEVGQEPVGVLVLRHGELLPLSGTDAVHVEQLYVHPEWRGRGAARALLLSAASLGERAGGEKLACSAPSTDREAARFLTRLGFAPLVSQRVVPIAGLVRRLTGESPSLRRRSAIDQLLARRRREQARSVRPAKAEAMTRVAPRAVAPRAVAPRVP
ncbi:MAG TPA: GNAT family N-acetyltransferase [Actinomycetales bacterium]|nr:GNAT family N-acetyltransferase [Actinomycetales bacterium]